MKVAVGSDHAGFPLKEEMRQLLEALGHSCVDMGTDSDAPCDYPDFARKVARAVASREAEQGLLVCGTGIGMSIAANKVKGIRAAICHDAFSARAARAHNDANILCMGARVVGVGLAETVVRAWLAAEFEGGRHGRRVGKIGRLEPT